MRGIALALGGPADAFERGIAGDPYWALRLVSYPVSSSDEKRTDDTGMMYVYIYVVSCCLHFFCT
jgi:isopenicillin N synthase-like dioxygenase